MRAIKTNRKRSSALGAATAAAMLFVGPASAANGVAPKDLRGRWTTTPPRCEQENGVADVLIVTSAELAFYEIGCTLKSAETHGAETRFKASCYKGGSPDSSGTVLIRRLSPTKLSLSLHGFSWSGETPEEFQRCAAR